MNGGEFRMRLGESSLRRYIPWNDALSTTVVITNGNSEAGDFVQRQNCMDPFFRHFVAYIILEKMLSLP